MAKPVTISNFSDNQTIQNTIHALPNSTSIDSYTDPTQKVEMTL
jgi:hypothetical protein